MSLRTEIKQFLADVKDPTNLNTTRVSLEQAVGLLERVEVEMPATSLTTEPKPEDKL